MRTSVPGPGEMLEPPRTRTTSPMLKSTRAATSCATALVAASKAKRAISSLMAVSLFELVAQLEQVRFARVAERFDVGPVACEQRFAAHRPVSRNEVRDRGIQGLVVILARHRGEDVRFAVAAAQVGATCGDAPLRRRRERDPGPAAVEHARGKVR